MFPSLIIYPCPAKLSKTFDNSEQVWIEKSQYFVGISKAVREYQIGGYQVMAKYLKDRKGRKLSGEEIEHYMGVATALRRTIEVQREIDEVVNAD